DTNVAVISILEVPDVPGMSFKVFSLMAQKKINVDIILQSSGRGNNKDLIFTVPLADAEPARVILEENMQRIGGTSVKIDTNVAKVSIVGAGMQSHSGVASKMFETLYDANINIHMISTSEIKISVLIDKQDADKAVNAIHEAFVN
ncbi:MAG: ACT domain-containing protein, partial [Ruthenibacterium sp.]